MLRAAQVAGFDVLRRGEEALRAALDRLAATAAPGAKAEPQKAFGRLHVKLNTVHRGDPAFDPVRRILRECILDTWPIAAGEGVMGEILPARRLHSLGSAALETGVGVGVLARLLTEAGVLSGDDDRPANRRTFDAQAHAAILTDIASLVGPQAMNEAMGATSGELASLEADGLLRPWSQDASVRAPWRVADGLALVAELHERASPVAPDVPGWERLQQARARTRLGLDRLIGAVRAGRLVLGRIEGDEANGRGRTHHDLVVRRDAVDALAKAPRSKVEAASPPSVMSAAEFGRSVGLWNHGQVPALAEAGYVPSVLARHPTTRRLQRRMSEEDIVAFHRRFLTIMTITRETGLHRNTIRARLAVGGVTPFAEGGKDFGLVYLREEAERALPELRGG